MKLSVIVPMLNEEAAIAATLETLRLSAPAAELIVVDGGSRDRSVEIARPRCDRIFESPRGRARQMNAGAAQAGGDTLAFVHADTLVPLTFARDIETALHDARVIGGRFDVAFHTPRPALAMVAAMINLRSRFARSATGDQAIFVRREIFERLGGYAEIELCEDVDFARRIRHAGRVACLRSRVVTSSRRWLRDGLFRTIVKMWIIKSLFLAGVSPARLKRYYADTR
ncbi:MAG TPA: TIGR04283 family arsenosugar biosynthesis glycosyltransferase [Candidatus Binataceae bacterium]|nr:TIGR04283 family arsenosugar biosynthesis glycosyltransferase [Candidatus Binataceae bacterium]